MPIRSTGAIPKRRKPMQEKYFSSVRVDTKKKSVTTQEKNRALTEFERWNIEFLTWKTKLEFSLVKVFQSIEQCSMSILVDSVTAFAKILDFYKRDLLTKKEALKMQQIEMAAFFRLETGNSIEDYLFYYENWFNNLLSRIDACTWFLYDCVTKHNLIAGTLDNSNRLQLFSINRPPELDELLTAYLTSVVKDKINKKKLIIEENKLSDLARSFISQIQATNSFDTIDREINASAFPAQIISVRQLNEFITSEHEERQKIKEKLTTILSPALLQFYMNRIDPSDTLELTPMGYPVVLPITSYTVPASFYSTNTPIPVSLNDSNYSAYRVENF